MKFAYLNLRIFLVILAVLSVWSSLGLSQIVRGRIIFAPASTTEVFGHLMRSLELRSQGNGYTAYVTDSDPQTTMEITQAYLSETNRLNDVELKIVGKIVENPVRLTIRFPSSAQVGVNDFKANHLVSFLALLSNAMVISTYNLGGKDFIPVAELKRGEDFTIDMSQTNLVSSYDAAFMMVQTGASFPSPTRAAKKPNPQILSSKIFDKDESERLWAEFKKSGQIPQDLACAMAAAG